MKKRLFKGATVCFEGYTEYCDIADVDGVITEIGSNISSEGYDAVYDLRNCILLPGLADVHVHFREPGYSYKETVSTGSLAAAKGGYTAVCTMPNLSPAPDGEDTLKEVLAPIEREGRIKIYPIGAISKGRKGVLPADYGYLKGRVCAISDDGDGVNAELMEAALQSGMLVASHCEDKAYPHPEAEWRYLERDLELVRKYRTPYHACHISCKKSVELIRQAKAEGLPVTAETAPHYILLSSEDRKDSGDYKMNPPLGTPEDMEAVKRGFEDGTLDIIATDHAPHSAKEKSGGYAASVNGIVGLETAFALLYTNGYSPEMLAERMSRLPRRIFGLEPAQIKVGEKTNFTAFDTVNTFKVDPESFLSKGRSTPFAGLELKGETILTVYGKEVVYEKNR